MSLPKEPRQKMINMMYLVLTALLALNVSSEILLAFRTVNNSIMNANGVIDTKNKTVYSSFEELAKDGKTAEKAKIWQPLALRVQTLSSDASAFIDVLKEELKKESGLEAHNGVQSFKEDNLDASARLFDTRGKGIELYNKLKEFKDKSLATLDPSQFADPIIKKSVQDKKAELEKNFPLDLKAPTNMHLGHKFEEKNAWSSAYFYMTPTIASLTILSKFQNDVKNSESEIVDYLLSQVGSVKVVFDEFQPLIGTNATYLMPGQELEITAGIGAYSKAATPTISIGGTTPALTEGKAIYKTKVSGAGEKSIAVNIKYTKPDGSLGTLDRVIKYTVGVPSGSSVFLEKMNVMYVGVENPLTISAGSAGQEKMHVEFTNGTCTPAGGDRFIAKPRGVGDGFIKVTVEGKTNSFMMRCKMLPDPVPMVGGKKGGAMPAAEFRVMGGVLAKLIGSEFDAPFQVIEYTIGVNGGSFPVYRQAKNAGSRWNGAAGDIINKCGPGTSVFFDDIKVKGPDGKERNLGTLAFQLR